MTSRAGHTQKRTRIQKINKRRILDAALDVFAAQGFKGSTIDQIAARAEMSKPNLLYYFRGKKAIYVAVLEHTLKDWLAPLEMLTPDGDPLEQIGAYIRRKMEMSRKSPKASRLFANELLHGAPMIGLVLETSLKTLVDDKAKVIEGWVRDGRIVAVDPHQLIFMIWATTQTHADFEVQYRAILGDRANKAAYWDAATTTALSVIQNGLRPRRGGELNRNT